MGVDDWKREERLNEAVKWKLGGMGRKLGGGVKQKLVDHELCAWGVDKLNFRAEMIKSLGRKRNCVWEKN